MISALITVHPVALDQVQTRADLIAAQTHPIPVHPPDRVTAVVVRVAVTVMTYIQAWKSQRVSFIDIAISSRVMPSSF